jgi:hypothetical protein
MQIVLQATQGIVSGSPEFFRRAFGDTYAEFENILIRPQHFIFNREWYEALGGRAEFEEYSANLRRLIQLNELNSLSCFQAWTLGISKSLTKGCTDPMLKRILDFYVPISKKDEREIWQRLGLCVSRHRNWRCCHRMNTSRTQAFFEDTDLEAAIAVA